MASVYPRPNSRFLYIRHRGDDGNMTATPTNIDKHLPGAMKKAKIEAAKYTIKELSIARTRKTEQWQDWALDYLKSVYGKTGSWQNVDLALRDLLVYFAAHNIRTPRQVTYRVAADFMSWRLTTEDRSKIASNTARIRFVYFSVLMAEAVRRGWADYNPCRDVRVRRTPAKEKEEITAEHQAIIEEALKSQPERMQDQWLIMMRQGCRIAETAVPMDRVDTTAMTITFKVKGGRLHATGLHVDLLPLVARAREEGRTYLTEFRGTGDTSRWCEFFKSLKFPYSSHCCRVTVITRLIRAGHSGAAVAGFVGHTEEINRIYRRLKPADSLGMRATLAAAPTP